MSEAKPSETLRVDERLIVLVSYLIVGAMMTCMVASFVQFGNFAQPIWDVSYLLVLGFLVSLESLYSHRVLHKVYFTDPKWVAFRFSELILILVALKCTQYLYSDGGRLLADLSLWQQDLGANFFNDESIFGIVTLAIAWIISGQYAGELILLEANQRVLKQEMESGISEDRTAIRRRLSNLVLLVGMGMVIFTAMLRFDRLTEWADLPPLRSSVYNTILYFFLGLVLLSLTQFNLLRARWFRDSLPVRVEIAGRWILYSAVFILVLALIAGLLPTSYSIGLLKVLNYLFFIIMAILNLLIMLLLVPVFWLFGLLARLFQSEAELKQIEAPPPIRDFPLISQAEPVPWWELLKSVAFWLIFLGVIGYALVYYFRENRELWEKLRQIPFIASLVQFFDWLGGLLRGVNRQIGAVVEAGLERLRSRRKAMAAAQPWRFINLRRLTPRERVRFYYLALVRRGGDCGYSRRPAQTPFEYSQSLSDAIRDGEQLDSELLMGAREAQVAERNGLSTDIIVMTNKFVEARYSRHEITPQDAGLVQRAWEHLRSALQRLRRTEEQE